jgi:hypothetical protein
LRWSICPGLSGPGQAKADFIVNGGFENAFNGWSWTAGTSAGASVKPWSDGDGV